jgi:hypothetical protein
MASRLEKSVTLYGGMAYAAREMARIDQRATPHNDGVALIIRRALRDYLLKRGYSGAFLDDFSVDVATGKNPHSAASAPVVDSGAS